MQVACIDSKPIIVPPSDVDKMKEKLLTIRECLINIDSSRDIEVTYNTIKEAVLNLNELVLSIDNANDFYKIGGFSLLHSLLVCSNIEIVAATAELISDLCQNNDFCQSRILDFDILPELVKLLDHDTDSVVCSKALYALSSLCRNNPDSQKYLQEANISPKIMRLLRASNEKIRTKAAFFLCYLLTFETYRDEFYAQGLVSDLTQLIEQQDLSTEHVLSALLTLITHHKKSFLECQNEICGLKGLLENKISSYQSKSEFQECEMYCKQILQNCFL